MADIDWLVVNARLPYKRTPEEKEERKRLWRNIDINGNGFVSLAEITKSDSPQGDDYLQFREFRLFLQAVRQFFEYYQAFDRIDTGDDNRVSREEFTSDALKTTIEKWVGPIENIDAEFDEIDKNGGGQILFAEFVDWALEKNLDIEDDVDEDLPGE
eukprot:GFUD01010118.1.p1 GENE.GFUD01010118.1~~GFUD01010118.1.p1  ORF type:complete len:157 (+),score=48.99 GFUD01010118.1:97-567(+)